MRAIVHLMAVDGRACRRNGGLRVIAEIKRKEEQEHFCKPANVTVQEGRGQQQG
jgi:hypothetical protein